MQNLPLAEKTNIKNWAFEALTLPDSVEMPTFNETDYTLPRNAILMIDGHVVHQQVDAQITVEQTVRNHTAPENKLVVLNDEKKNSVLKITVAKNAQVKDPLSVLVFGKTRSLVHASEVVLEQGAALTLTETFVGEGAFNANVTARIAVGKNARLTMRTLNEFRAETVAYHRKQATVDSDGVLNTTNFLLSDANLVFEDLTYLQGKGAEAQTKTVAISSHKQQQNVTVRMENSGEKSVGNIVNYGITKDEAHLAFNGVGKIQKDAKGCDNQQETRLLNLSKTAEAVANPFLLIDEGDITAGHAASIGQLDEEQVYYLMSRGMTRQEASQMIVAGFLTPFVDALEEESMRIHLAAKMQVKLEGPSLF